MLDQKTKIIKELEKNDKLVEQAMCTCAVHMTVVILPQVKLK